MLTRRLKGTILALASDDDEKTLAAATNALALTLFDRSTLQPKRELSASAHEARINELSFAPQSSGLLYSASSDGTVRAWDAASPATQAQTTLTTASATGGVDEAWTLSAHASLLAAGTESAVVVWDVRKTQTPLVQYAIHTEAVTQVRFRHGHGARLLTGSVDELICEIDCTVTEEDEAVINILNAESPVTALGLFGDSTQPAGPQATVRPYAWALSSVDTLSTWDLAASERLASYADLGGHTSADYLAADDGGSAARVAAASAAIEFVVGCHWDEPASRLLLLGGVRNGAAHLFEVPTEGMATTLPGGGLRLLRSLPRAGGAASGIAAASSAEVGDASIRCFHYGREGVLVTGAEDGVLCAWAAPGAGPGAAPRSAPPATTTSVASPSVEAAAAPALQHTKASRATKKEEKRAKPYGKPARK